MTQPPRLALWLLETFLPAESRETVIGDLIEADEARRDQKPVIRQLVFWRETFAARMMRAFTLDDCAAVFPHPDQLSLFAPSIDGVRPILVGEPVKI